MGCSSSKRIAFSLTTYLDDICLSITGYHRLQSISLALVVGFDGKFGILSSESRGQSALIKCRRRFLDLLLRIRSSKIETITLRLAPSLQPVKEGRWQFRYHSSRSAAIDIMFGRATRELLMSWPLENLQALYLHIVDNCSEDHDATWWHGAISSRLGGDVPCGLTVNVDHHCECQSISTTGISQVI